MGADSDTPRWSLYYLHPQFLQDCKIFCNLTSIIFFCYNDSSCVFAIISVVFNVECLPVCPIDFLKYAFFNVTVLSIKELNICHPLPWQGSCFLFDINCLSRKQMCQVLYYSDFDFYGRWFCIITTGNFNTYVTESYLGDLFIFPLQINPINPVGLTCVTILSCFLHWWWQTIPYMWERGFHSFAATV